MFLPSITHLSGSKIGVKIQGPPGPLEKKFSGPSKKFRGPGSFQNFKIAKANKNGCLNSIRKLETLREILATIVKQRRRYYPQLCIIILSLDSLQEVLSCCIQNNNKVFLQFIPSPDPYPTQQQSIFLSCFC